MMKMKDEMGVALHKGRVWYITSTVHYLRTKLLIVLEVLVILEY